MENAIELLKSKFGTEFGTEAVRAVANELGTSYASLSKKLQSYKVSRGKWNLEVTQEKINELEDSYNAPPMNSISALDSVKQNLIPEKMIPSSALVTFLMLKKLFLLVSFTLPLLLVFLVMAKLSLLSKLVLL